MGDLLLSQSTPCPCCFDLAGSCSSRSLTFSQSNAMSECTWHCQLYPARLDRLGAGWQMQSSFTPAQHDVQPNLYITCKIGLALRKWSCESWDGSLFLVPSSDFTGAENGRPRRWVMSQLTAWELVPCPSTPLRLCPLSFVPWAEGSFTVTRGKSPFRSYYVTWCVLKTIHLWGKQCSPNSKCVTWSFACCGNWC